MAVQRYTAVAIALHWAIAAAVIVNFAIGWWMHGAIEAPQSQARAVAAFQIHKSLGLTILLLSLLRLAWRLGNPPPPLPAGMPVWERVAAKTAHWCFYTLMIVIPLSGWLYVSTQWRGNTALNVPTVWFGLIQVPHLFGLNHATQALRQTLAGIFFESHAWLAKGMMLLLALHVAAALKHQLHDRDAVLGRMLPFLDRQAAPAGGMRRLILWGSCTLILLSATALGYALLKTPGELDAQAFTGKTITSAGGSWQILPEESRILFSGVHAGAAFAGRFTRWQTNIRINPDNVGQSEISATIATASATDGISLHDKTLPQKEWFDVKRHPVALFKATQIRQTAPQQYAVSGQLMIKGNPVPVPSLTLVLEQNQAIIGGQFTIDRKAAALGMESDPNGTWVSREITVDVRAVLERPQPE